MLDRHASDFLGSNGLVVELIFFSVSSVPLW
mgnify:CR=1 FL=1